jgi:exodeoxyribonuclease V beta subunit
VRGRLEELAARSEGRISVERADASDGVSLQRAVATLPDLEVAVFDRKFDERWRRTSYSGITADAHDPRVGSESDEQLVTDEPPHPAGSVATAVRQDRSVPEFKSESRSTLASIPLLLSGMPGGVEVGSFVHGVLESTDFAAADLDAELRGAIDLESAKRSVDLGDRDLLVVGLRTAIESPLGDLADGKSLRQIARPDRLDEVSFELPLAGGENPCGTISMVDVAKVLRDHLTVPDQVAAYADRLEDPTLARSLRGYLTGSIDLVFRFSGHRLAIVDYKTNRLAPTAEELNAWHYRPEALAAEMQRAHYPLQAILYTVALHRYLRWRDPDYEAARDLAGVLYLFVRGMSSPAFPTVDDQPCGVWSWRPPSALIEDLSDLFDRGSQA